MPKVVQPNIGVVILTHNAVDTILPCLRSLLANTYTNFSILVVDNNSTDGTITAIRKTFPKIDIVQNTVNNGYGAGNNIGIRYFMKKRAKYILLLNPDTIVKKDLLEKLSAVFSTDERIGVAGPIITYAHDKKRIWYAGGYFNQLFCYARHPFMNQNLRTIAMTNKCTDFVTGACMMIRTAMLHKTGLLPEEYFLYFEDAFFCQRIQQKAYRCYLLAEALAYHYVSASTGNAGTNDLTPLKAYYFARNPTIYIRSELYGLRKYTSYAGQLFIHHPYFLLSMVRKGHIAAILAYIRGIHDGWLNSLKTNQ